MFYKWKIYQALLLISFVTSGCSTSHSIQQNEPVKPIKIEPITPPRSSSLSEIEARIIRDLKSIGKSDDEINSYMAQWRIDTRRQIQ